MVPAEEMGVVFDAMDCHPTSKVVLTQACLVLGNIGRTGKGSCLGLKNGDVRREKCRGEKSM